MWSPTPKPRYNQNCMGAMGYKQIAVSSSERKRVERTEGLQRAFLAAFAACGRVNEASRWAHISRNTHHDWLRSDPTYRPRFEKAIEANNQALEDEAIRRAVEGVRKPVMYKGKQVHVGGVAQWESEYSDTLLQMALRARMPDKYKERVDLKFDWDGDPSKLTEAQLDAILYAAERAQYGREEADRRLEARKREDQGAVIDVLPEPEVGPDGW